MRTIDDVLEPHQAVALLGVSASHDSVEMGVDMLGVALPHELMRGVAGETRQRFRLEPSVGHKRWSAAVRPHAVQYLHHFSTQ